MQKDDFPFLLVVYILFTFDIRISQDDDDKSIHGYSNDEDIQELPQSRRLQQSSIWVGYRENFRGIFLAFKRKKYVVNRLGDISRPHWNRLGETGLMRA